MTPEEFHAASVTEREAEIDRIMQKGSSRTPEDWQKLFPILEIEMNDHYLNIRLKGDKGSQQVSVPKQMFEAWMKWWQQLQEGTIPDKIVVGRWYTGQWEKVNVWASFPKREQHQASLKSEKDR